MDDVLAMADRFFRAVETGDLETVRSLYTEDVVVWHNDDLVEQTADQNLRVLRWMAKNVQNLRYEEVRRHVTATGFVQQHVVRGIWPTGAALELHACIVFTVRDGRITRLEEYLDPAHLPT